MVPSVSRARLGATSTDTKPSSPPLDRHGPGEHLEGRLDVVDDQLPVGVDGAPALADEAGKSDW
jgi:hypothetical protein